jgi:hypothetical protein
MIALYEHCPARAEEHLKRALQDLSPLLASPIAQLIDAAFRMHLATALAQLGKHEEAEHEFQKVEPVLRAHRRDELIEEYERAMRGK